MLLRVSRRRSAARSVTFDVVAVRRSSNRRGRRRSSFGEATQSMLPDSGQFGNVVRLAVVGVRPVGAGQRRQQAVRASTSCCCTRKRPRMLSLNCAVTLRA